MDQIHDFSDARLKAFCAHCGADLIDNDTDRDHVPSRALLLRPYPENLPVVRTCRACNVNFSLDEEYLFLFLRCVIEDTTDPDKHSDAKVSRALRRHEKLRAEIELSKSEQMTIDGGVDRWWHPDLERINRVVLKNARGHVFYEYSELMINEPEYIQTFPLNNVPEEQRESFENDGANTFDVAPELGSRMMTRMFTGQDMLGGWIFVQDDVYRYRIEQCSGIRSGVRVRSILHEYLATEVYWSRR